MRTDAGCNGIVWSQARRLDGAHHSMEHEEAVLEEMAVSLILNGKPYAVMMITPDNLEDFFVGFLYGEGVIRSVADIITWESVCIPEGLALYLQLSAQAEARAARKRRLVIGGSACGLCGTPSFEGLVPFTPVDRDVCVEPELVHKLLHEMRAHQRLNRHTGTAHAAVLAGIGGMTLVREDIGRHNAVDKTIGAALRQGWPPSGNILLGVSSRLTIEIALKALNFQVPIVAAISGVSSLAIQIAQTHNLTLIGYARDRRLTIYAHGERFRGNAATIHDLLRENGCRCS